MPLCGSSKFCGCAVTSVPADFAELDGFFPSIDVAGGGTPESPWNLTLNADWAEALVASVGATRNVQIFSELKNDADTTITATSPTTPTYITGTYINVPAVDYERVAVLLGQTRFNITAGGTVLNRAVLSFPATRVNATGPFVNNVNPIARLSSNGQSAAQPIANVHYFRLYTIPANEQWEFRMYGYRTSDAGLTVVASTGAQTAQHLLVIPKAVR